MRSVIFIENPPFSFEINPIFGSPYYSMFEFCVMIETLGDDFFKTLATNFPILAGSLETRPDNSDIYLYGQSPSDFLPNPAHFTTGFDRNESISHYPFLQVKHAFDI